MSTSPPTLFNLGCGSTIAKVWRNFDINPINKEVEYWHANNPIPATDCSVDVIYNSHMLEHLNPSSAKKFLKDCHRVLKKNGIIRIVVPDLEQICHQYLKAIQRVDNGEKLSRHDASWMRLEIFDQMTRDSSGGGMEKFLKSNPPNSEFIINRCGEQVKPFFTKNDEQSSQIKIGQAPFHLRVKAFMSRALDFNNLRNSFLKKFLGKKDYAALQYGRFHECGELHKFMYDRILIKDILQDIGFSNITVQSHSQSIIPNWKEYGLDSTNSDTARKPDSLYIEAIKPA